MSSEDSGVEFLARAGSEQARYARNLPAAFGALRSQMPDHLYALTGGRRIYTSPWVHESPLRRCSASFCLTATGESFKLTAEKRSHWLSACAIRPMVQRALHADNVRMVVFQIEPSNPLFPRFRRIAAPGVLPLERKQFDHLNQQLNAAYSGALTANDASDLFDEIAAVAIKQIPRVRPIDKRITQTIELLWAEKDTPLQELASRVGLSYFRLSHLFAENMGITLRQYQMWRKLRKAISLSRRNYSLAELAAASGFADAAHFTRAFAQLHAAPPSYFFYSGNVKIVTPHSSFGANAS
jgi:AraC family transcriptional regulator, arabinose operon regulatory protein